MFALTLSLIALTCATPYLNDDMVELLGSIPDLGWTPGIPEIFRDKTKAEIIAMLGGGATPEEINAPVAPREGPTPYGYEDHQVINVTTPQPRDGLIYTVFTAGTPKTKCNLPHRDLGEECAASYVFGPIDQFSITRCLLGDDATPTAYSTEFMLMCNVQNTGCRGGGVPQIMVDMYSVRIPTEECVPYVSGFDGIHSPPDAFCPTECMVPRVPYKTVTAVEKYAMIYGGQKGFLAYMYGSGRPFVSFFDLYLDFLYYRGGVFCHTSGSLVTRVAPVVVGFGGSISSPNTLGTAYWLLRGQWGQSWGESGAFRVKRGIYGTCNGNLELYQGYFVR